MKNVFLKLLFVVSVVLAGIFAVNAMPQYEDEPVSGGLTPEVKVFLDKYFHHARVVNFESEDGGNRFEINLSDGYSVDIRANGQWEEIEAPEGVAMPVNLVKKFLPKKTYNYLESRGVAGKIGKLSFDFNKGFEVDFAGQGNDMFFTRTGMVK